MKRTLCGSKRALDEGGKTAFKSTVEIVRTKGLRFQKAEAAHAPEVLSELVDENFFNGVGGPVLSAQSGAQMIELNRIFAGDDQLFGIEAMPEGVR